MATKNEIFGKIGERLVEIELLKRNIAYWNPGDLNPEFDLIIEKNKELKKIQIKTSNLINNKFQFFLKNCVGGYDYLILVGIRDKNFRKNIFYIIPKEELSQENIKKGILGLQTGINFYPKTGKKYTKFKENWSVFL